MKKFLTELGINADNFTLSKLLIVLGVFLAPIAYKALGIITLIVFDCVTGIISAHKNKIPITSKRFAHTLYKMLLYMIILVVGLVSDKLIETNMFVSVIVSFLTLTELYSISENWEKITGLSIVAQIKKAIDSKIKA